MRVIAGIAKGHRLSSPEGMSVRPTLDRVKESLFSILYPYLRDAVVLDLFAGAGSLGIEALSRSAKRAVFVDNSKRAYDCIIENLRHTKLLEQAKVIFSDWRLFLDSNREKFDLIFLDPPYSKGIEDQVFSVIEKHLSEDGIIILESEDKPSDFPGFSVIRQAKYGRVIITLFKKGGFA